MKLRRIARGLTFEPVEHLYRFDGCPVSGVTSCIPKEEGYQFVAPDVMEKARARGEAVDLAIQRFIEGTPQAVSETVLPYLKAYQLFKWESRAETIAIQSAVYDPYLQVAGTLDEIAWVNGRRVIFDWKATNPLPKSVKMQVGAYARGWNLSFSSEPVFAGRALHLLRTGQYRFTDVNVDYWQIRFYQHVKGMKREEF